MQNAGDTIDAFLIVIKTLACDTDLCDACLNRRIVTRIMFGVRDMELRMKLLATSPLPDLQKVTDLCRSEESAKLDEALMNSNQTEHTVCRPCAKSRTRVRNHKTAANVGDPLVHSRDKQSAAKNNACSKCNKKKTFSLCYFKNKSQPQQ